MLGGLGLVTVLYFDLIGFLGLLIIFLFALGLFLVYQKLWKVPVLNWFVHQLERKENLEKYPGLGTLLFVLSAVVVVGVFPKDIAMASLVILSFGDSIPVIFGPYGKIKYFGSKKKTWEGILIGIVTAGLAARFFLPWYEAWLAALVAMLLEGFDLKIFGYKIDDNLMMPVVAAVVAWGLRFLI